MALALVTSAAHAAPCGDPSEIEQLVHRGDDTLICAGESCWRIDKRGHFADLPKADWPARQRDAHAELVLPEEKTVDYVKLRGPAEIHVDDHTVEVCTDRCRSFTVKPRSKVDDLTSVTVLADKHTVFVGTGQAPVTNERLLRFDLDHPDAGRLIGTCAEVWDAYPGGNVLVQKSDCANAGGPRILFSSTGKRLAVWDVRRAVAVDHLAACTP